MFPWQKKELPAAQTKAAADSAFGLPEEPQCPAVEALVGAGEAGSLAKWWGWAAGRDGYSSAVIGERVCTGPQRRAERDQSQDRVGRHLPLWQ